MPGPPPRLVRFLVPVLLSATAVLAGCGSSAGEASKSAAQIFSDAQRATETASSVHVSGRVTSGGDQIDLDVVDATGRSGGSLTDNGATFQVVVSGRTVYIEGSVATMTKLSGSAAAGTVLGGKWLMTTTASQGLGNLPGIFDLTDLLHNIRPQGTLHKGSPATVDGRAVIGLTDSSRRGRSTWPPPVALTSSKWPAGRGDRGRSPSITTARLLPRPSPPAP